MSCWKGLESSTTKAPSWLCDYDQLFEMQNPARQGKLRNDRSFSNPALYKAFHRYGQYFTSHFNMVSSCWKVGFDDQV